MAFVAILPAAATPAGGAADKPVVQTPKAVPSAKASMVPVDPDYVIGKEDVLSIDVWKEPELTRTVAVRSDGKISFPLIGDVQAAGATPSELQTVLIQRLNDYMVSAVVSVSVQDARSQRISILGEVVRPGNYGLVKPMTVLDALAAAGGFRDFAKINKMFILRTGADGKRTRIPVSYKKAISEKRADDNMELQPRDTLIVP
jgi:polysaccharide export outer membrane protein